MLTSAPEALVKEPNIVIYHWNLCNHSFQNITYALFNTKVTFFLSLTSASEALVSMAHIFNIMTA
jgi:hypothetical protein